MSLAKVAEHRFNENGLIAAKVFYFVALSLAAFIVLMIIPFDLVSIVRLDFFLGDDENTAHVIARVALSLITAFIAVGFFVIKRQIFNASSETKSVENTTSKSETAGIFNNQIATPSETRNYAISRVIANMDVRLHQLLLKSNMIYWTIILSLIAGVFLIIFAGVLSSWDTTVGNLLYKIEIQRDQWQRSAVRAVDAQNDKPYTTAIERLSRLDALYDKVVQATIDQATHRPESMATWNWPSTILRIGVIGLLVFLTQILISLYRYTSRLISFYGSRRDALLLAGPQLPTDVEKLNAMLFPSNLDFGREPRHPLQEMLGFLRRGGRSGDVQRRPQTARGRNRRKAAGEPQQHGSGGEANQPPSESSPGTSDATATSRVQRIA
jgi:hypothetical protein